MIEKEELGGYLLTFTVQVTYTYIEHPDLPKSLVFSVARESTITDRMERFKVSDGNSTAICLGKKQWILTDSLGKSSTLRESRDAKSSIMVSAVRDVIAESFSGAGWWNPENISDMSFTITNISVSAPSWDAAALAKMERAILDVCVVCSLVKVMECESASSIYKDVTTDLISPGGPDAGLSVYFMDHGLMTSKRLEFKTLEDVMGIVDATTNKAVFPGVERAAMEPVDAEEPGKPVDARIIVADYLADYLTTNGYAGLCNDICSCDVESDSFANCIKDDCRPAKVMRCGKCHNKSCDFGKNTGAALCDGAGRTREK